MFLKLYDTFYSFDLERETVPQNWGCNGERAVTISTFGSGFHQLIFRSEGTSWDIVFDKIREIFSSSAMKAVVSVYQNFVHELCVCGFAYNLCSIILDSLKFVHICLFYPKQ